MKYKGRSFKIPNTGIIVKVYKTPVTHGSLILPVQKVTQQAKVKFIGDKHKPLKVGDDILFDAYKGIKMEEDGLLYLEKEDVLAQIER